MRLTNIWAQAQYTKVEYLFSYNSGNIRVAFFISEIQLKALNQSLIYAGKQIFDYQIIIMHIIYLQNNEHHKETLYLH